nr:MAG TPA: hypothetical protein [Caudoviricetes sp.]
MYVTTTDIATLRTSIFRISSRNFIDFIDIDNTLLSSFDIVTGFTV